jgi:hypothetical protein
LTAEDREPLKPSEVETDALACPGELPLGLEGMKETAEGLPSLALGILQVEGHALECHHRVHIPQLNAVRDLGVDGGIVQYGLHIIP